MHFSPLASLWDSWRFFGETENQGTCLWRESKSERLESVEHRDYRRDQSGPLGVEEQSQGACQANAEGLGGLACEEVVENDDGIGAFQGQREHFGLTRIQAGG